ncbi:hypothetical protein BDQ17DRAFT_1405391 [Cyathus striatus]|nr:hypothetical protein BDQ17DRAFT_1405391 [Cyathus striatus]
MPRTGNNDSSYLYICGALCLPVIVTLIFALVTAVCVLDGVLSMLIGNAIFRDVHPSDYTDNRHASIIGAVGGCIASVAFSIIIPCLPILSYVAPFISVGYGAAVGAIGSAVLDAADIDIGHIDVRNATKAGAVGGAILIPIQLVMGLIFYLLGARTFDRRSDDRLLL